MNALPRRQLDQLWSIACRCRLHRCREELLGDLVMHVATLPIPREQLLQDLIHLNQLANLSQPDLALWLRRAIRLTPPRAKQILQRLLRQVIGVHDPSSEGVQVVLLGVDGARRSNVRRLLAHLNMNESLALDRLRSRGFLHLASQLSAQQALAMAAHFDRIGASVGLTPHADGLPLIRRRPFEGVVVAQLPGTSRWLQVQPMGTWLIERLMESKLGEPAVGLSLCKTIVARMAASFGLGCVVRLPTRQEWDFARASSPTQDGANRYGLYGECESSEWLSESTDDHPPIRRRFRLLIETTLSE